MTDETSQLLSDTVEKLFSDHVTKNCIIDAEKGTWPDELWSEVIANGFNLLLVPEELGGVGGNWMNAGILFKAPDNVIKEFPQFPVTHNYDEFKKTFIEIAKNI